MLWPAQRQRRALEHHLEHQTSECAGLFQRSHFECPWHTRNVHSKAIETSSLLNGREQPIAPTRTHEGPQFSDLARLTAFDGLSTRALDHAVLERKVHGYGRIIGVALAPGFRQVTS